MPLAAASQRSGAKSARSRRRRFFACLQSRRLATGFGEFPCPPRGVSDWHKDRRGKLRSVRPLRGIDSKVSLNKGLGGWRSNWPAANRWTGRLRSHCQRDCRKADASPSGCALRQGTCLPFSGSQVVAKVAGFRGLCRETMLISLSVHSCSESGRSLSAVLTPR